MNKSFPKRRLAAFLELIVLFRNEGPAWVLRGECSQSKSSGCRTVSKCSLCHLSKPCCNLLGLLSKRGVESLAFYSAFCVSGLWDCCLGFMNSKTVTVCYVASYIHTIRPHQQHALLFVVSRRPTPASHDRSRYL